jgi:hypothetical protein
MYKLHKYIRVLSIFTLIIILTNCGGNGINNTVTDSSTDEFNRSEYKGLVFYPKKLSSASYTLTQLDDSTLNALNKTQKLKVANKLLSTLFYGYDLPTLESKLDAGNFIEGIRTGLNEDRTDKEWLENYIVDDEKFSQNNYNEQVAVNILTRFYAMKELDSYFLNNWVAYILTQTIMFSPAYELESTHTPNIARVYNRLVTMLNVNSGMRYISYVHMMSEDNWRRFRSPEDNGREMMEIFTLDMDDSHVPLAGQALQNWKLDRESDTLVVSLNQNRKPLQLFNTTIYNGDDFYREMAKSDLFTKGVTTRLVNFFFPNTVKSKKTQITNSILSSHPEAWQDILLQIVFSEEYLLHTTRAKSAEELFFSMSKKIDFKHRTGTFHEFKKALEEMHQASMKYKLGKLKRVPLDTLSFANYHKFIRERMLLRKSNSNKVTEYKAYDRQGWSETFVQNTHYTLNETDGITSLESFIQYLFHATISRDATNEEMQLFKTHMLRNESETNTTKVPRYSFNLIQKNQDANEELKRRESRKRDIATIVLDYISRLTETYTLEEVK